MSLLEDVDKLNYTIRELLDCISEVTIYEGRLKDDPKFWIITFNGSNTPLKIDAEDLIVQKRFLQKYFKLSNTPAPRMKTDEWETFLRALSARATVGTYHEETDNVYIAETVLEKIRDLPKIKKEMATWSKGYIEQDGYRCVHHNTIKESVEGLGFKFTGRILSDTLTQLGYKEEGTNEIWINELKKPVRFWWFKESAFVASSQDGDNNA